MNMFLILPLLFCTQIYSLPQPENALIASGPNHDFHCPIKLLWNEDTGPVVTDVEQNGFGDCWFLATLASILETPDGQDVIRGMIKDDSNPNKADVTLFDHNGQNPQHYIIDKPSLAEIAEGSGKLSISGGGYKGEARSWVAVLEKAMMAAGYSSEIKNGGWAYFAMRAIYGGNVGHFKWIKDLSDEDLWTLILATPDKPSILSTIPHPETGFLESHGYSLLGSTTGNNAGDPIIRNPWSIISENVLGIPDNPGHFNDLGDGKFIISLDMLRRNCDVIYIL